MKKTGLLRVFIASTIFVLLLFVCFCLLYLPRVRFHEPVSISVMGPGGRQLSPIHIYGITPLSRKIPVDPGLLAGRNGKIFLFSDILIGLDSVPADSVSGIVVRHGSEKTLIGQTEVARWYANNKAHPLLPLSAYIGDHHSSLSKLWSLLRLDWWAYTGPAGPYMVCAYHFFRDRILLADPFLLIALILLLIYTIYAYIQQPAGRPGISSRPVGLSEAVLFMCFFIVLMAAVHLIGYSRLAVVAAGAWTYITSAWQSVSSFFSYCIPFLLLTLGLPSLCILVILARNPIAQQRIIVGQTDLAKSVFFICLLFFVMVQAYGIYYYKLRLQGTDHELQLVNYSHIDLYLKKLNDDMSRHAYVLTQLILFPCFMLHLPLDVIGRMYCLNDACFHLFIALAILFFTRRYDLAAVVLAAPLLLEGVCYYAIVMEIFLTGSIMVLYMAVYRGLRDGALRNLILYPCLYFMIWSHPISMMIVAVFLAGIYRSVSQLIRDKWILLFILANVYFRVQVLTDYDHDKIRELYGSIDLSHLLKIMVEYAVLYWHIILLAVAGTYIAFTRHKNLSDYRGLLILPLVLYFCTAKKLDTDMENFEKFTYPVNLFILMQGTVLITAHADRYRKYILAGTCIILIWGISIIAFTGGYFRKRVIFMETLNTMCLRQDPWQSKWYVSTDSLQMIDGSDSPKESFIFSSFQKLPLTIQLVIGDRTVKKTLDRIPGDYYYITGDSMGVFTKSIKDLNPYYFRFYEGPYKELMLDSARLAIIRKACR